MRWTVAGHPGRLRITETLFTTTGFLNVTAAVQSWASGASNYDPNNPVASSFTQVVWKATTQVGCAACQCAPGTVIADDKGDVRILSSISIL